MSLSSSDGTSAPSLSGGLCITLLKSNLDADSCELKSDVATVNSAARMLDGDIGSAACTGPSSIPSQIAGFQTVERSSAFSGMTSWDDVSDINTVLGDAKSRLKSDLKFPPQSFGESKGLGLERARRRSRVDIDLFLKSNIGVEGGYLQGLIKIHIGKHQKKGHHMLVSGGKVMVIGFESDPKQENRFIFYRQAAMLSEVASDLDALYTSEPDIEGFSASKLGDHWLPFALCLSSSSASGEPKGTFQSQSGLSVRYIVMVFLTVKDSASEKKSIAHMYRECSIWPCLNPSYVLASASRPLQATVSDTSLTGKIRLTVSLHRLHWVAGQLCFVCLDILNESTKALKNLSLELVQSVSTFRQKGNTAKGISRKDTHSTTRKVVARSILVAGENSKQGRASAKGWWVGVPPGTSQSFYHSISLPSDALTVKKFRLVEVSYAIQVTITTGALFSSDVVASLPVEIINFLSIDPPPDLAIHPDIPRMIPTLSADEDSAEIALDSSTDAEDSAGEDEDPENLMSMGDTEEMLIQRTISSARIDATYAENAPRFADLYYSSRDQNFDQSSGQVVLPKDTVVADTLSDFEDCKGKEKEGHTADRKPPPHPAAVFVDNNQLHRIPLSEDEPGSNDQDANESRQPTLRDSITPSSQQQVVEQILVDHDTILTRPAERERLPALREEASRLSAAARDTSAVSFGDIIDTYIQLPDSRLPNPHQQLRSNDSCKASSNATRFGDTAKAIDVAVPRPGTVKDKIRELEELAAKANGDN